MSAISGNQLALTTARVGAMRVGAFRVGFVPTKTWNGVTPGVAGALYIWKASSRPATSWTTVVR